MGQWIDENKFLTLMIILVCFAGVDLMTWKVHHEVWVRSQIESYADSVNSVSLDVINAKLDKAIIYGRDRSEAKPNGGTVQAIP